MKCSFSNLFVQICISKLISIKSVSITQITNIRPYMEYLANRDRHFTISTYLHINFHATQYIFYWKLSHSRRKLHTSIERTPSAGTSSNKTSRDTPPFSSRTNRTNPSTAMMLARFEKPASHLMVEVRNFRSIRPFVLECLFLLDKTVSKIAWKQTRFDKNRK